MQQLTSRFFDVIHSNENNEHKSLEYGRLIAQIQYISSSAAPYYPRIPINRASVAASNDNRHRL